MPNIDYVTRPSKINFYGEFSLDEFYALVNRWLKKHNFDNIEKEHAEAQVGDGKDYLLKIAAERDEDDYHDSVMEVSVRGEGLKPTKRKDHRTYTGKITISVRAVLRRDIKNKWTDSFGMHFIRSLWDKWGIAREHKKFHNELSQEVKDFIVELKSFFNLETRR